MTSPDRRHHAEIFLVSFAALLLEISYTRLISFKLFYYYTYLIIGFAMLGVGAGGVLVAISRRLRAIETDRLIAASCVLGAITVAVGYWVITQTAVDTRAIWSGEHLAANLGRLLLVCFAMFASFVAVGVVVATLFSRRTELVSRLYFADLLGAGIACAVVVPLLAALTPAGAISLGGAVLAAAGLPPAWRSSRALAGGACLVAALCALGAAFPRLLPEAVTDRIKTIRPGTPTLFSRWSPVFRIDVTETPGNPNVRIVHHDGLWGSTLHRFDGNVAGLTRFVGDERSFPFRVLGRPPARTLIIGAAGGHEVLASLFFGAGHVRAVELNPVTVSLTTLHFAEYTGRLAEHPRVSLVNAEGRSFLSRDRERYDLIFFVAPDSYSAMNAATAGAFVLSESYLYTVEMLVTSLQHLTDDGVLCMQFGEFAFDSKPNRTARYVGTAREALRRLGATSPAAHVLVATSPSFIPLSTILLKRAPFSRPEIDRFLANAEVVRGSIARHVPGRPGSGVVNRVLELPAAPLAALYDRHPYRIQPVFDDSPFFWHFARFGTVLRELDRKAQTIDPEDSVGERLLVIMLGIAVLFAAVFLLLPFVVARGIWSRLTRKLEAASYFAALGLGFMFFEICLIQKLTLFLGYPTYSLTVTLMSLLVFTGLGSLSIARFVERRGLPLALLAAVAALTLFFQLGLPALTGALLGAPLALRIATTVVIIAPLGLTLGAFMPLGLAAVSGLTAHRDEYVAWAWAVNGFFSVLGSVLTTMLSMSYGFRAVLLLALAAYALAVALLLRLRRG
jgi:hypothetical protein